MGNHKSEQRKKTILWVIKMTVGTFFIAVVFGLVSQILMEGIEIVFLSVFLLLFIVFLGVLFDTIGTAAAAADEAPLNAKATRKIFGAQKGVYLVRRADQVANFCNDVVGDVTGILSGAVAALLVLQLAVNLPDMKLYLRILLTALVTSLTVGGKAWGKYLAINYSTEIMLAVGRILSAVDLMKERISGAYRS